MSGAKKPTIRSLSEEVDKLKDQMKDYLHLKSKVSELETKLDALENAKNDGEEGRDLSQWKCKKWGKSFNTKKILKTHQKETHTQEVNCGMCNKGFARNCDLEVHIEDQHKAPKQFECDKCDMRFFLNWRLEKHKTLHTGEVTRKCHYFNNNKKCPFEDLGCMFIHRESEKCKFDEMCSKKLCSYKHSKNNLTSSSSHEKEKDFSSKTSEPVKEYKFECEYCTFKSDSYMDFLDHINNNHLESEEERDDDNDDIDKNTKI